jgi:flagellar basal-body rod modification protein FlgD
MIPGNAARPDENGEIHGMLDLPSASGITNLAFKNADGELLHTVELGSQPAGLVGFSWTDVPAEVVNAGSSVRIEAYAEMGNGMESLTPNVFAEVLAASTGDSSSGVVLDVRDYGEVRAADVGRFKR